MKSKTSLSKGASVNTIFNTAIWKRNIVGGWGIWAGLFLFWLVFRPLMTYFDLQQFGWYLDADAASKDAMYIHEMITHIWNQRAFTIFYAVSAVAVAMFVFSYLFTPRNSNMLHTYPVSRISLFTTNFISGFLFLMVPLVIASVLELLVGMDFGAVDAQVVKHFFLCMGTAALENLFFFSAAVCMLMFVGNIIAVPVLFFILNFFCKGCVMIVEAMVSVVCYGLEMYELEVNAHLLAILTPIQYMRNIGVFDVSEGDTFQYPFSHGAELAGYTVAAVFFIAAAIIAYKKKHVETAGDVVTVGWLKPIFRWGIAICVSAAGALFIAGISYEQSFALILTSVSVIGAAAFFIAQMLLERSVHVFTKKRVRECLLYTVIIGACYFGLDADLLGLETKVPSLDQVEAAKMDGELAMYSEAEDEISWIQEIHRQVIGSKKQFEQEQHNQMLRRAVFTYYLKDGSTVRRSYWLPDSDAAADLVSRIRARASEPEVILANYFGIHYPDIEVYGGTLLDYSDGAHNQEVRISQAHAKKLYQAAVKDIEAGHFNLSEDEKQEPVETTARDLRLVLNVRDEGGFKTPDTMGSGMVVQKDAEAEIMILPMYTYLNEEMQKLGYLSK